MADKVFTDSIGIVITINMGQDISLATTTDLLIKINNNKLTWTGAIYGTNYIQYTTASGDLKEAGTYYIQPYLVISGVTTYGETVTVEIFDKFEEIADSKP